MLLTHARALTSYFAAVHCNLETRDASMDESLTGKSMDESLTGRPPSALECLEGNEGA